jgi:hypothetical protein
LIGPVESYAVPSGDGSTIRVRRELQDELLEGHITHLDEDFAIVHAIRHDQWPKIVQRAQSIAAPAERMAAPKKPWWKFWA